jgi:hypothetical protein
VNNIEVSQTNAATAAQDPAVTPESIVEQLRALRSQVPHYGQLPVSTARALRSVASLNPQFEQAAIHSVSASSTVQATRRSDSRGVASRHRGGRTLVDAPR